MTTATDIVMDPPAGITMRGPEVASALPMRVPSVRVSTGFARLVDFYELTKPRMNFLVVITTMVGFYMASSGAPLNWLLLVHTLLGTALTASCGLDLGAYPKVSAWIERMLARDSMKKTMAAARGSA